VAQEKGIVGFGTIEIEHGASHDLVASVFSSLKFVPVIKYEFPEIGIDQYHGASRSFPSDSGYEDRYVLGHVQTYDYDIEDAVDYIELFRVRGTHQVSVGKFWVSSIFPDKV